MKQKKRKTGFWVVLGTINIAVIICTATWYLGAEGSDAQIFGAIVFVVVAFLLAIVDAVSVLVAHFGDA
jgi:hypothetical protein